MTNVLNTATIALSQDSDGILTLVMDDPDQSANVMNQAFQSSFAEVTQWAKENVANVSGIIITSAKSTFFAGGDLTQLVRSTPEDAPALTSMVTELKANLRALETLGIPVVAAMNGTALGGGLELALACHHRVLLNDPKVRVGLPEVTLGLLPGAGGVTRTVRMLGLVPALQEVLLKGTQFRPEAALQLGLVDALAHDQADLLEQARAFVLAHPESQQRFDQRGYRVPGGLPSNPKVAQMLPVFAATLVKESKGSVPQAAHHILATSVEGLNVSFDAAMDIETRYFVDLACSQTATNLIQAFWFDLNRINAGSSRPSAPEPTKVSKVAVLGAGMMGAGIAHVLAKNGVNVVLKDVDLAAAERGKKHAVSLLDSAVKKGRMSAAEQEAFAERIVCTADAADTAGCDAVIEAVFEDINLKHQVFGEVEPVVNGDALLCSNTSTLPISELAAGVQRPEDFIGLHFFSPVERMPLVEIIVGERTSEQALARAYDVVRQLKKTPIVVNDSRGFFTSRVFGTLVLEGAALVGEGVAPMSVERAALQAGFPAGPLTLMDEVSLTLMTRISQSEGAAGTAEAQDPGACRGMNVSGHPGFETVRTMVELGRTGKAAGGGFFDWQPSKRLWPGLSEQFPRTAPATPPLVDIQDRLLFSMALETVCCVQEGVLRSVEDANIGSIMGIGYPPFTGGVLQFIDQYPGGVSGFVARARELEQAYGARFAASSFLTEVAMKAGSVRAAMEQSA